MSDAAQIIAYQPGHAPEWDRVVARANGGTVLHSRRFLDYHGARFRDLSLVAIDGESGQMTGVFPLAADPGQQGRVVSHPGSSFGGVVTLSRDAADQRAFLLAAARHLKGLGFDRLLYRLTPPVLLRQPDDGLMPRLIRLGRVTQLDLWSVLSLTGERRKQSYWRTEIRIGTRRGLRADSARTPEDWAELHSVVAGRIKGKYGRGIVHSPEELLDLDRRLGAQSRGIVVRDAAGVALAGLWFIDYGTGTLHNQYTGATPEGLAQRAAAFGLSQAIESACDEGFTQFSFGRSTEADGWTENQQLMRFKAGYGSGLVSQFHIEVALDALIGAGD